MVWFWWFGSKLSDLEVGSVDDVVGVVVVEYGISVEVLLV